MSKVQTTMARVRYAETDAMRVVYYANFFVWMEVGRVELFRSQGLNYKDVEARGLGMPVVEAHCRYRHPAIFDDQLLIRCWVEEVQAVRLKIAYEIQRAGEQPVTLAEGYTLHACVNREGKPVRFPDDILALMSAMKDQD